ncbi:MAG: outer membrane lipoprotein carrier protein LolA [Proteobacteria bacterium]|nr:outer membrane lipoprotein carrier protein LolA [Pseudomonadota bacterium]MCZ6782695.1 outer membrane lipoprotein carrier protein LolA [Pseudomonadota bacterium]
MKRPIRLLASLVLVAAGTCAPAWATELESLTLEELMRGMAGTAGVLAEFREVKDVSLLSAPIVSEGTLYFIPPDRMARHTRSPSRSALIVDGSAMRLWDEAGDVEVDLSGNPVARLFVENFIVLFNGDLEALRRRYEPEFESGGEGWTLSLVPRTKPASDLIARITLRGDGTALRQMEVAETDGDRTVTTFTAVEVDRPFSEDEIRRAFRTSSAEPAADR